MDRRAAPPTPGSRRCCRRRGRRSRRAGAAADEPAARGVRRRLPASTFFATQDDGDAPLGVGRSAAGARLQLSNLPDSLDFDLFELAQHGLPSLLHYVLQDAGVLFAVPAIAGFLGAMRKLAPRATRRAIRRAMRRNSAQFSDAQFGAPLRRARRRLQVRRPPVPQLPPLLRRDAVRPLLYEAAAGRRGGAAHPRRLRAPPRGHLPRRRPRRPHRRLPRRHGARPAVQRALADGVAPPHHHLPHPRPPKVQRARRRRASRPQGARSSIVACPSAAWRARPIPRFAAPSELPILTTSNDERELLMVASRRPTSPTCAGRLMWR